MSRKPRSDSQTPDFEQSLQQLETLIGQLERGDLPLAESLTLFEQGVALTRHCHAALTDAQQRVEILLKAGDGTRTASFDADAEDSVG
jgi:exodeoxyribonuclease VII small subunit